LRQAADDQATGRGQDHDDWSDASILRDRDFLSFYLRLASPETTSSTLTIRHADGRPHSLCHPCLTWYRCLRNL
jgi:hypothetical protein